MDKQIPFICIFEESCAEKVVVDGEYNEKLQMIEYANGGIPTTVETDTGGFGDTDTGND